VLHLCDFIISYGLRFSGARPILRNTRRVRVMLARSHLPLRVLFATAARRLAALGP
jgi:hypothetical protein